MESRREEQKGACFTIYLKPLNAARRPAGMARKLRLESPGAIYHVLNRGNYRAFVFKTAGAKQAFDDYLFAACERSGWLLHAYVIMGNREQRLAGRPARDGFGRLPQQARRPRPEKGKG